ncbi:MAG TPA: glutaredoxin family protein [Cellvibrio sp.]|nr:glutaredoxin family protein [Cellvibrio sp.]
MKTVYLYSTPGCHLCDLAWEVLTPLIINLPLRLEEVDIAGSDELIERYGVRIPVLKYADHAEDLGWPFDDRQAADFLARHLS